MNYYSLYANFEGENFYPSKSREKFDNFVVSLLNDKGDKKPVWKDEESEEYTFGYVGLQPKKAMTNNFDIFTNFLTDLIRLKSELCSDELDIVVSLEMGYETQCNFELPADAVKLLATLNATFTISCYQT